MDGHAWREYVMLRKMIRKVPIGLPSEMPVTLARRMGLSLSAQSVVLGKCIGKSAHERINQFAIPHRVTHVHP